LTTSPFAIVLSPPEKSPAEYRIPENPPFVEFEIKNVPLTVLAELTENTAAEAVAFEPEEAAENVGATRVPCEYPENSFHPACVLAVSPAATAEYPVELINPKNHVAL
jgi:hypothetical protein